MGALVFFTIPFASCETLDKRLRTSVFPEFVAHKIQVEIDVVSGGVEIIQVCEPH